jgi:hypothetical protein
MDEHAFQWLLADDHSQSTVHQLDAPDASAGSTQWLPHLESTLPEYPVIVADLCGLLVTIPLELTLIKVVDHTAYTAHRQSVSGVL